MPPPATLSSSSSFTLLSPSPKLASFHSKTHSFNSTTRFMRPRSPPSITLQCAVIEKETPEMKKSETFLHELSSSTSIRARFDKMIREAPDTMCEAIAIWEKAGINVSVVYGVMPPEAYRAAKIAATYHKPGRCCSSLPELALRLLDLCSNCEKMSPPPLPSLLYLGLSWQKRKKKRRGGERWVEKDNDKVFLNLLYIYILFLFAIYLYHASGLVVGAFVCICVRGEGGFRVSLTSKSGICFGFFPYSVGHSQFGNFTSVWTLLLMSWKCHVST
ncbi:putative coproporphyrinogen oxidase [Rosa chinensis]|uniref:Putative coproporphyrinogen oxidase n=1 Tax=Rosa chinensis TaxID=74649 RepID=A0A2P6PXZ0_ROSCH|nr:putative coproporphyrinogen oxidase [Rosa chinensis]